MNDVKELTRPAQRAIRRAERHLASAERDRLALIARQRKEREAAARRVADARDELRAVRGEWRVRKTARRSNAVQAGPAALDAVRSVLRRARGRLSQNEIVARTELNEGTVSYAVRALIESGELVLTGRKVDGSRELALVGAAEVERSVYEQARAVVGARKAADRAR